MVALAGEVICRCGSTLVSREGHCHDADRGQVVCLDCRHRYDKEWALAIQDNNVNVVLKRCPKGCEARMVKTHGGVNGKMECPECGAVEDFAR